MLEDKRTKEEKVQDAEANYFAMCLLMPSGLVKQQCILLGGVDILDDDKVGKLSDMFRVPRSLMAIRLKQVQEEESE